MKAKLTPVGRFGKSTVLRNAVAIQTLDDKEIRIDYINEEGAKMYISISLEKWTVVLYVD